MKTSEQKILKTGCWRQEEAQIDINEEGLFELTVYLVHIKTVYHQNNSFSTISYMIKIFG